MTVTRYLFRDGVLIDEGTTLRTFDEVSQKGDYLLTDNSYKFPNQWLAYRMTFFESPTPSWNWFSQPESVAKELRALLLLQKS